jgi:hypothetical protein
LVTDPDTNLRVDAEVRQVREAVKKSLHRDLVDIDHRPAATPEDLLEGINEVRPHVVHFSGHGGGAAVLFDDGQVDNPQGRTVPFDLLARALVATDTPPTLLVLNACDTIDGADALLNAVQSRSRCRPASATWAPRCSPRVSTRPSPVPSQSPLP